MAGGLRVPGKFELLTETLSQGEKNRGWHLLQSSMVELLLSRHKASMCRALILNTQAPSLAKISESVRTFPTQKFVPDTFILAWVGNMGSPRLTLGLPKLACLVSWSPTF